MEIGKNTSIAIYDVVYGDFRFGLGEIMLDELIIGYLYREMWRMLPLLVPNSVSMWSFNLEDEYR